MDKFRPPLFSCKTVCAEWLARFSTGCTAQAICCSIHWVLSVLACTELSYRSLNGDVCGSLSACVLHWIFTGCFFGYLLPYIVSLYTWYTSHEHTNYGPTTLATRRNKLSVQDRCILQGNRVVIPKAGRADMQGELHKAHPGEAWMNRLDLIFVWWPGSDHDI